MNSIKKTSAVIYARYSSERQNEQSIAGQVEVCKEWAKNNDVDILTIYHDEALTGKTDKRPEFQKMIKDAKNGKFSYILVYKLDRFARNRYDSAMYKAQLKKYDVKVISVMENIADGPEGIILESVLEGMAEYYSANLSQNVLRGMRQRAEIGKFMGGKAPLGYKIDKDKNYIIDEDNAFLVRRIFEEYTNGRTAKEIRTDLNAAGYKTITGKPFGPGSLLTILKNEKYIGIYKCMDIELKDVIPRIIEDDLFRKAQFRLAKNKRSPASSKGLVPFHLTGKLFCGKCGANMVGDGGTSRSGTVHHYYACVTRKKKRNCSKKSVRRDWIENLVTDITVNQVLTDENISYIAQRAFEINEKERLDKGELTSLKNSLNEVQKNIDNIMRAIEQGIITPTTKERLLGLEEQRSTLLNSIAKEEIQKPTITRSQIEFFLYDMKNKIYNAEDKIEVITRTFINSVYLYDDKIILTFNFTDGDDLKKIEISNLESFVFKNPPCTI